MGVRQERLRERARGIMWNLTQFAVRHSFTYKVSPEVDASFTTSQGSRRSYSHTLLPVILQVLLADAR